MAKGGGETQTTTVTPDPATQLYQNFLRGQAMSGAGVALGQPLTAASGFIDPQQMQSMLNSAYDLSGDIVAGEGYRPGVGSEDTGRTAVRRSPDGSTPLGGRRAIMGEDPFTPFAVDPALGGGPTSGFDPNQGSDLGGNYNPTQGPQGVFNAQPGSGAGQTPESFFTGPQQLSVADQIQPFMDPYQQQVIGGIRGEFDHLRGQAQTGVNQGATQAGAFGSARHGAAQGVRLGELDRAQASQVGQYLSRGFTQAAQMGIPYAEQQRQLQQQQIQEPLWRQQQAMGLLGTGLGGPSGQTTASQMPGGSVLGSGLAGGLSGFGATGGPWGAGIGALAGILGSL